MALVAFGANLPSGTLLPKNTIPLAIAALVAKGFSLVAQSRLFASPAFPAGNGPDYVNAAAGFAVRGDLAPDAILATCHSVEAMFGRVRAERWGRRTLDIDLLAVGDRIAPDRQTYLAWRDLPLAAQLGQTPGQLILPHPRLHQRAFVLVPLADVAPGWMHPVIGQTVADLLAALPAEERAQIKPLAPAPAP